MADVKIIVSAEVAQANAELKKLDGTLEGMGKSGKGAGLSLTDLKSGIDLAIGGFKAASAAVQSVIDPTIAYAAEVRTLGRTIGSTAEESSKLIQAADDVGISAGTLQGALQAAIRKGVSPTIEGISALAEQYNAIQDPIERTKFLMDNFGRSGAALAPLMEQGAAGIRAAGVAAEETGLVMSQDGVDSARQYEIALDNLEDAVLSVKLALAKDLIPAITDSLNEITAVTSSNQAWTDALAEGIVTQDEAAAAMLRARSGASSVAEELANLKTKVDNYHKGLTEVDPAVQNMRLSQEAANAATAAAAAVSENYTNQLSSQDQWLQDITVHTQEAQIATENSTEAASALAAGLSGTIGQAQEDYKSILSETSTEIDKLNADLAKYEAAQGSTWTVTTTATASMAEYELAQIKAATAAQKLAEYTGDNREELLQLQVASDNANEKVANLGTQMGISTTYTADYTTKILETNISLAELNAKQAEAEAQLALTTSQFLFQQVAASLTKEAQLELANSLGLIDDESYNAALAMQELTTKYDQNGDGTVTATEATDDYKAAVIALRDSIASMTDRTVNIRVNTVYQDQYLDAYREATGGGRAEGGPVSGGTAYMVGERGPELVVPQSNGYVMNNDMSGRLVGALEKLANSGGNTNNYYGVGADMAAGLAQSQAGAF